MDSKRIAAIVVFAALTIALNLSPIRIPAPYAPFLIYQIWEIPIVTAFLLYGSAVGVAVAVVNTLFLLVMFPGGLPTGPFYNLAAILSMLLGIYIIERVLSEGSNRRKVTIAVTASTLLGVVLRVAVMSFVNWVFLRYPPPIGYSLPSEALIAMLPIIGFFNATIALYTVPLGYILAKAVSQYYASTHVR